MNIHSDTHFRWFQLLALVVGSAISWLYFSHLVLTGDQTQMLYKGYLGAYSGQWLAFGNAASAVGNVPGNLSALIVGVPIMIWDSPYAPVVFLLATRIVAYLLLDDLVKKAYSTPVRFLFLVMYWLNPWFQFESNLYNPSYLFFFAALHLWTAFAMRERPHFVFTVLHVLAIGAAMQLHYSWVLLPIISAAMFYKQQLKIHWLGLLSGVALVLASLWPYFQALSAHPELRTNKGNADGHEYIGWGLLHVWPLFKGLIYWLRYATSIWTSWMVNGAKFEWLSDSKTLQQVAFYVWQTVIYVIGLWSAWWVLKANKRAWLIVKPWFNLRFQADVKSTDEWLLLLSLATLIAIFIGAAASPFVFSYWHLIIIFPIALLPVLSFADQYWQNVEANKIARLILLASVYFGLANLIGALDSKKFRWTHSYAGQVQQYLVEQKLSKEMAPPAGIEPTTIP